MAGFPRDIRSAAQGVGEVLYRIADNVGQAPFMRERQALPTPIQIGTGVVDTVDDLTAFTGLDRDTVMRELQQRRGISFRSEWLATPRRLRRDHWFYLSSKAYLFGNASHSDDGFVPDFVASHVSPGDRVLEFGGGSGELSLRLAAAGLRTTFVELNALQRDFVHFRVARHGLSDLIDVLAHWDPIPEGTFHAVIAMDVIEHLPDAREVLANSLIPALRGDGVLIENTPFVVNAWNPMHHDDFGFDHFMHDQAFAVAGEYTDKTRAWRRR
jgi:2-polyprenyl-3-methyl-5-hydroxy-6-metoxy-1,4-benzoquinol methylase